MVALSMLNLIAPHHHHHHHHLHHHLHHHHLIIHVHKFPESGRYIWSGGIQQLAILEFCLFNTRSLSFHLSIFDLIHFPLWSTLQQIGCHCAAPAHKTQLKIDVSPTKSNSWFPKSWRAKYPANIFSFSVGVKLLWFHPFDVGKPSLIHLVTSEQIRSGSQNGNACRHEQSRAATSKFSHFLRWELACQKPG